MNRRRFDCVVGLGLALLWSLAVPQGAAGSGEPARSPRVSRAEEEARVIGLRRAALAAALGRLEGKTYFDLPEITAAEIAELADGDLVRRREPPVAPGEPQRVVALQWFELPRSTLWIACQDPHLRMDDSIENLRLSPSAEGHTVWYGLIDLPWPFKNRQWVIEVWDHHPLAEATGGESWEHVWQLDLSQLPEALDFERLIQFGGERRHVLHEDAFSLAVPAFGANAHQATGRFQHQMGLRLLHGHQSGIEQHG